MEDNNPKPQGEKVPILVIYTQDGHIKAEHPENGTVPIYQLIGYLECYLMDLKEKALDNWEEYEP